MTIQPLETARLHLVPSSLSLAPMVTAHYIKNREHLRPTSPLRPEEFFTLSRQTEGLMEDVRQQEAGSSVRFWLFPKEAPQTIAGMVHLSQISRGVFLSCFLGYHMDQDFLRKGYMTEAVAAVVDYAFGPLGLHRVEANVMPRNLPSLSLLRKLGFEEEGLARDYLKICGQWEDHLHMAKRNTGMSE